MLPAPPLEASVRSQDGTWQRPAESGRSSERGVMEMVSTSIETELLGMGLARGQRMMRCTVTYEQRRGRIGYVRQSRSEEREREREKERERGLSCSWETRITAHGVASKSISVSPENKGFLRKSGAVSPENVEKTDVGLACYRSNRMSGRWFHSLLRPDVLRLLVRSLAPSVKRSGKIVAGR